MLHLGRAITRHVSLGTCDVAKLPAEVKLAVFVLKLVVDLAAYYY